ncbi:hypothetical protein ACSQ67_025463 [Phaseolus vulgaris]
MKVEVEKASFSLTLAEMEHSRVEDALNTELRLARKEGCRPSPQSTEVGAKVDRPREATWVSRESRDDAMADLSEANKEKVKMAAEVAQAQTESKKVANDLLQAQRPTNNSENRSKSWSSENKELKRQVEGFQKQIEELKLSSARISVAGLMPLENEFACLFPDLDLGMVSLNNEVVDGKVVPPKAQPVPPHLLLYKFTYICLVKNSCTHLLATPAFLSLELWQSFLYPRQKCPLGSSFTSPNPELKAGG